MSVKSLYQRIASLSPAQRALLGQKLPDAGVPAAGTPATPGLLPLSMMQHRQWLVDQLDPGNIAFNLPILAFQLRGRPDQVALAAALCELERRHESLRTVFRVVDGEAWQVIRRPRRRVPVPVVDFAALGLVAGDAAARALGRRDGRRPFDLSRGPLWRATLLRLAPDHQLLILLKHHIISDGWSMGVMYRELTALYASYHRGEPPSLPELRLQYRDFAAWQRRFLNPQTMAALLDFWRHELAGAPTTLDLPFDRPRPKVQAFDGYRTAVWLPDELQRQLLARQEAARVTQFMFTLALFKVLLYRLTGQDDLVVASPMAGRDLPGSDALIGFFVNTIVVRTRLAPELSFHQLLARVRERVLEVYEHRHLPFDRLVEALHPRRDPSYQPLAQVSFALQNIDIAPLLLAGLTVEADFIQNEATQDEFTLFLCPEEGVLVCAEAEYNTGLFDRTTAHRMVHQFLTLAAAAAADPQRPIAELPLLAAGQRHQLLAEWNDTAGPAGDELGELLKAGATRPEAVAVMAPAEAAEGRDAWLSYGELQRRAGRLACRLRRQGIGPEVVVAIYLPRSPEMVVAVRAVLAAGAAYLPLDPAWPAPRLAALLAESAARAVLTDRRHARRLPAGGPPAVVLPSLSRVGDDEDAPLATAPSRPDHLAYVLYTSGSTGQPKGVQVSRRAIAALLHQSAATWAAGPAERVLEFSSLSFDSSVEELLLPLICGGTAVLRTEAMLATPARFAADCHRWGLTMLYLATAYWHSLVAAGDDLRLPPSVRWLIIGGEAANPGAVAAWSRRPGPRLINSYGPSEATVVITEIDLSGRPPSPQPVPIGRPHRGVTVYVAGARLSLLPPGVPGELLVGGVQLARGYLLRPGLTARRFLPDPWGRAAGGRLYRTGDLVRTLADGCLEFLGRTDEQIKVRGFRIEPAEIEALLTARPEVQAAVVVAYRGDGGDSRLVAFVVARPGAAASAALLRGALREQLPAYMVPGVFEWVEALPLSTAGKVDRLQLARRAADLHRGDGEGDDRPVGPRTPVEEMVVDVWRELLGGGAVGVHENFFDRGGHSLLATQVVLRLRSLLGVELPLRQLFEAPTAAELAEAIEARLRGTPPLPVPAIAVQPRRGALPASFAQQRLWLLEQLLPGSGVYHMPGALDWQGPLEPRALAVAFADLARRQEVLRTVLVVQDGVPVQVVAPPSPPPLPVVDLRALPAPAAAALGRQLAGREADRPFDLARGPLWRAVLLRRASDHHALLLTLHHAAGDGWSVAVLERELLALYQARRGGQPSPLAPLPVQYADFAVWQRQRLSGELLAFELAYWQRQLAPLPAVLELPLDRPRPAAPPVAAAAVVELWPAAEVAALTALGRRAGATLFMTLLAGFGALLGRLSGQQDLCLGTPIAGRNQLELEGLIGCFVNSLVLRVRPAGELGFRPLLEQVRETCLGAYAHQELPFERLVEELQPERSLGYEPLFQVMLALHNTPPGPLRLPGVLLEPLEVPRDRAPFDLMLVAVEDEVGLHLALTYKTDLFDPTTVRRWLGQLRRLLAAAAESPSTPVAALPQLAPAQRHQLLVERNDSGEPGPPATLAELCAVQAAGTPAAVALVDGEHHLSYGELRARTDALAGRLYRLGVAPEVVVAVLLPRSAELVTALLAVLAAGGAYLPLDPAQPAARHAGLLADAGAAVLVSRGELAPELADAVAAARCRRLDLAAPAPVGEAPIRARDVHRGDARQLAYVIYTSGSTGRPKGVEVGHGNAVERVRWAGRVFTAAELAGVLASTAVTFDMSIFELFAPLCHGGTVILARDALQLPELPARHRVSVVNTVPSVLAALLATGGLPAGVRTLNLGGEALPRSLVDAVAIAARAAGTTLRLLNLYGPSEDTTYSTAALVQPAAGAPAIGRPLPATRVYLLDAALRPVPPGAAGELCLAGAGLTRGYRRRPALTARAFRPDPFACRPGERLYRTGDRARYRTDGQLDYLGRFDDQIKLRGFRVEPAEVEAALAAQPGVRAAAVTIRRGAGDARLIAFVVPVEPGSRPRGLRRALRASLPEHLVPSQVRTLEALPCNPNGKVDRAALARLAAAQEAEPPRSEVAPQGPRDTVELILLDLFRDFLERPDAGLRDSFFDLGGHSLLAVRLLSRAGDRLGRRLPLASLFAAPTVEELAQLLRRDAPAGPAPTVIPVHAAGMRPPLFCVHALGGHVLPYAHLARALGPDQPLYGLQAAGLDGREPPRTEVEAMAAHYVQALRQIRPHGPYQLLGWSFGGLIALEIARQLAAAGAQVALLALLDTHLPPADPPPPDEAEVAAAFYQDLAAAGASPADLDAATLQHHLAVYRAHLQAFLRYRPRPYGGKTLLLHAAGSDPAPWCPLLAQLQAVPVSGDHVTLLRPPAVEEVADILGGLTRSLVAV